MLGRWITKRWAKISEICWEIIESVIKTLMKWNWQKKSNSLCITYLRSVNFLNIILRCILDCIHFFLYETQIWNKKLAQVYIRLKLRERATLFSPRITRFTFYKQSVFWARLKYCWIKFKFTKNWPHPTWQSDKNMFKSYLGRAQSFGKGLGV